MSIVAIVENDIIKLPPGVHLADGTMVRVEPAGRSQVNSLAWLSAFAGTVEGPKLRKALIDTGNAKTRRGR